VCASQAPLIRNLNFGVFSLEREAILPRAHDIRYDMSAVVWGQILASDPVLKQRLPKVLVRRTG